jgi:hypothetical protein
MTPFLTIDGDDVPLSRCLRYLRKSGHLAAFLGEIIRQHLLEREFAHRTDLEVSETLVEIALNDFCEQRQLTSGQMLEEWLIAHDEDAASLVERIRDEYRLEKLKHAATTPELAGYFLDRKPFLDRVTFSRIVVESEDSALTLRARFEAGLPFDANAGGEFARLAPIERAGLPPPLREALESARQGQVLGPFPFPGCWALYLFEEDVPASAEDPVVKKALREELFERWLGERMELLAVELHGADD